MIRLAAFFALFGFAVNAQSLPSLYDVSGVAPDDILNVREGPSVATDIVEVLSHRSRGIEVLRVQAGWGLIGAGEINGWVSMNFMSETPDDPQWPLICYGVEPFWALSFSGNGDSYTTPDIGRRPIAVAGEVEATNGYLIDIFDEPSGYISLIVQAARCSDGMSEREFGMSATLFSQATGGNYIHNGCCTFQTE